MSPFHVVRLLSARIFATIGYAFPEVKDLCLKGQALCEDLDYEGGNNLLKELYDCALEMEDGWLISELDSLIHDPVCNYFYDHKANMENWGKYWSAIEDRFESWIEWINKLLKKEVTA